MDCLLGCPSNGDVSLRSEERTNKYGVWRSVWLGRNLERVCCTDYDCTIVDTPFASSDLELERSICLCLGAVASSEVDASRQCFT